MANTKSETRAIPRSIRVSNENWAAWEARASELNLSITAWLHMLAAESLSMDPYEKAREHFGLDQEWLEAWEAMKEQ